MNTFAVLYATITVAAFGYVLGFWISEKPLMKSIGFALIGSLFWPIILVTAMVMVYRKRKGKQR